MLIVAIKNELQIRRVRKQMKSNRMFEKFDCSARAEILSLENCWNVCVKFNLFGYYWDLWALFYETQTKSHFRGFFDVNQMQDYCITNMPNVKRITKSEKKWRTTVSVARLSRFFNSCVHNACFWSPDFASFAKTCIRYFIWEFSW